MYIMAENLEIESKTKIIGKCCSLSSLSGKIKYYQLLFMINIGECDIKNRILEYIKYEHYKNSNSEWSAE